MDIRRKEVIVEDPATGVTEVSQVAERVATPADIREAKVEKKNQAIWYIVGLINVLLALRVVFLLLGAKSVGFASFLYAVTAPFTSPFRGIFPAPAAGGAYLDTAAILAIIVVSLIGWALSSLLNVTNRPASVL